MVATFGMPSPLPAWYQGYRQPTQVT